MSLSKRVRSGAALQLVARLFSSSVSFVITALVLARVLPGASARSLAPLVAIEEMLGLVPDPMRRLAVLGVFDGRALRFSKARQRQLEAYQSLISHLAGPAETAYRHGAAMAWDIAALRAASLEQPVPPDTADEIAKGTAAVFPVRPRDLMPGLQGAALGDALRALEARWIASGFTLSRADLLA